MEFQQTVEVIDMEWSEGGEAGGEAELPELLLSPLLTFGLVNGHDEYVAGQKGTSPVTLVRLLRHRRLAGDQFSSRRERLAAIF